MVTRAVHDPVETSGVKVGVAVLALTSVARLAAGTLMNLHEYESPWFCFCASVQTVLTPAGGRLVPVQVTSVLVQKLSGSAAPTVSVAAKPMARFEVAWPVPKVAPFTICAMAGAPPVTRAGACEP